jgi:hypothetical protein
MPTRRTSDAHAERRADLATCLLALAERCEDLDDGTLQDGLRHLGRLAWEIEPEHPGAAAS